MRFGSSIESIGNDARRLKIPRRLLSIDFMKGIAMFFVIFSHLSIFWEHWSWISLRELTYTFYRPTGPANYILLSIFGMILSIRRGRDDSIDDAGRPVPLLKRRYFKRLLVRVAIFMLIGSIINIINYRQWIFILDIPAWIKIVRVLFTWNIISYMGVCQLVVYFSRNLRAGWHLILGTGIILSYYILMPMSVQSFEKFGIDYRLEPVSMLNGFDLPIFIYIVLMFENSMAPLVPWLAYPFIVNVVFGRLVDYLSMSEVNLARLLGELRRLKLLALGIALLGIAMGAQISPGTVGIWGYLRLVHEDRYTVWNRDTGGYPLFLQLNTPSNAVYSFGLMMFFLVLSIEYIDIKGKNRDKLDKICSFGKYSLTVFITHAIAALVPLSLSLSYYLLTYGLFMTGFVILIHHWDVRGRGVGSLEWLIVQAMKLQTGEIKITNRLPVLMNRMLSSRNGRILPLKRWFTRGDRQN